MTMRGLLVASLACAAFACNPREPYTCGTSDQCVANGENGVCTAAGFCAFANESCSSGYQYDSSAGGGLGGSCVGSLPIDASDVDASPHLDATHNDSIQPHDAGVADTSQSDAEPDAPSDASSDASVPGDSGGIDGSGAI
jgi:hypothetical protein